MRTNDDIKVQLAETYGDEIANSVKLYPDYADAFKGISTDDRAVYDYGSMLAIYAVSHGVSLNAASDELSEVIDDMDLQLGENHPILYRGDLF